jgi:peptidoglycan/LPS O-acetylase OafA/YrhL
MFYALAPFLARAATWALATIAVTGLALKLTLVLSGLNHDPWLYRFFPTELPIFILGMMACRMRGRLCSAVPPLAVLAATLLVQPVAHVANKAGIAPEIIGQLYLAVAIIGLPSLFRLSQSSRFDAVAGELSYPVYLTHFLVIEMLRLKFPSGGLVANSLLSITAIAVTLPVSWLLIKAVERPVEAIRSRRRRFAAVEVAQPV